MTHINLIERNLNSILQEIKNQQSVGLTFPAEIQSFIDQIAQINEFINLAGEYGLAYEYLVALLEDFAFVISGANAIKLLEVGLLMKFKTHDPRDEIFRSS